MSILAGGVVAGAIDARADLRPGPSHCQVRERTAREDLAGHLHDLEDEARQVRAQLERLRRSRGTGEV